MGTLNELAKEIHENSVAHGWYEPPRSFGEIVALCHSELSEALEEYRAKKPMVYCAEHKCGENESGDDMNVCLDCYHKRAESDETMFKPEGIAVEMADCLIRILDWCGSEGVDIDEIVRIKNAYNRTRPYKHGGKLI